jgi:hypothetical protein
VRIETTLYPGRRYLAASMMAAIVVISAATINNAVAVSPKSPPAQLNEAQRSATASDSSANKPQTNQARLLRAYGKLPLSFEINQGQTDPRVKFLSRGSGYSLFLTVDEVVLSVRKAGPGWKETRGHRGPSAVDNGRFQAVGGASLRAKPARPGTSASNTEAVVHMRLVGANPNAKISGIQELPGRSHYFVGKDPSKWRTNVPNYARVKYENVYPGVDLVYYGNRRQLEYDFVVQPGADARQIRLAFDLASTESSSSVLRIDRYGDLVIGANGDKLAFHKPLVYQVQTDHRAHSKEAGEVRADRHFLDGKYHLKGNRVTFDVAHHDNTKPLVIDPTLVYSTFLGGSRNNPDSTGYDEATGIAVDGSGSAYVVGQTASANFPTTAGAFQPNWPGTNPYINHVFVSKLNAAGSGLVYSTFLGGSGNDVPGRIRVDSSGNAYLTGWTESSDFPITSGAFQTTFGAGSTSAFITKLNASGSDLAYSTYLGTTGGGFVYCCALAIDGSGDAYVMGRTNTTMPITPGAFQTVPGPYEHIFVTKLNPGGSGLLYSTYVGGDDEAGGIMVDAAGNAYITGAVFGNVAHAFPTTPGAFQTTQKGGDAFVTKLNPGGSALVYSTFLGGSSTDWGTAIALDSSGNAYVTSSTASSDFPITAGAFQTTFAGIGPCAYYAICGDVAISKLNPAGSALVYSTFLGGSSDERAFDIAVDALGDAHVTGTTLSTDFPITQGALRSTLGGIADCGGPDCGDAFVSKLNAVGSTLLYSTYLGGNSGDLGYGIAVDLTGNAYIAGITGSPDFPTTDDAVQRTYGGGDSDAFVSKFGVCTQPKVKSDCKNGGWRNFCEPSFKNQGQCVAFVNHHQ